MTEDEKDLWHTLERTLEAVSNLCARGLRLATPLESARLAQVAEEFDHLGAVHTGALLREAAGPAQFLRLQAHLQVLERLLTREVACRELSGG